MFRELTCECFTLNSFGADPDREINSRSHSRDRSTIRSSQYEMRLSPTLQVGILVMKGDFLLQINCSFNFTLPVAVSPK